jgi:hypothetical protein
MGLKTRVALSGAVRRGTAERRGIPISKKPIRGQNLFEKSYQGSNLPVLYIC